MVLFILFHSRNRYTDTVRGLICKIKDFITMNILYNTKGDNMKKRIEWLDMLKGWGMILVMFAHAPLPDVLRKYIYSFHIPLFFFISGYLFTINKYSNIREFFLSKIKSLLIPYFIFSTFNYLFWLVFRKFANNSTDSILKPFVGIFIGIRGTEWTLCNGTLWFVLALFISEVGLYFILKYLKYNIRKTTTYLAIFTFIGYLYSKFIGIRLVWSIDVAFTAIVFLGSGYLIRKINIINKINNKYIILLLILNLIFGMSNTEVNMFSGIYGNYIFFYIASVSGILANILLIKSMPTIKIFNYVGKNTFIYLALHQYIIYSVLKKVSSKIVSNIQSGLELILVAIVFVIVTLILLYPVIYITNKYFPFIVGKKKKVAS